VGSPASSTVTVAVGLAVHGVDSGWEGLPCVDLPRCSNFTFSTSHLRAPRADAGVRMRWRGNSEVVVRLYPGLEDAVDDLSEVVMCSRHGPGHRGRTDRGHVGPTTSGICQCPATAGAALGGISERDDADTGMENERAAGRDQALKTVDDPRGQQSGRSNRAGGVGGDPTSRAQRATGQLAERTASARDEPAHRSGSRIWLPRLINLAVTT